LGNIIKNGDVGDFRNKKSGIQRGFGYLSICILILKMSKCFNQKRSKPVAWQIFMPDTGLETANRDGIVTSIQKVFEAVAWWDHNRRK